MKKCTCGYIFDEGDVVCPNCGTEAKEIPEIPEDAAPLGAVNPTPEVRKEKAESPAEPENAGHGGAEPDVAPISSIFEGVKKPEGGAKPRQVKKPERPVPGPNVEIKPVANAAKETKFDPMKTPPPVKSRFSLLGVGASSLRMFMLLIPVVGLIYSIVLTLGASKKENVRTLGTAYLTARLVQVVVLAAALLAFLLLFSDKFDAVTDVVRLTIKTFIEAIKKI